MGMQVSEHTVQIQRLIWADKTEQLDALLQQVGSLQASDDIETPSLLAINSRFRGNTPLCLAIMLNRRACVEVLLGHGASCLVATSAGFYPLSEAVSMGDRDVIRMVMTARFAELRGMVRHRNPKLYKSLTGELKDFYLELKWKFHSWLPFWARFLPNDTCRLWKYGNNVRIDTTLVGIEGLSWQRGSISFLFNVDAQSSSFYLLDHEARVFDEVDQLRDYNSKEVEESVNYFMNVEAVSGKLHKSSKTGQPISFNLRKSKTGWFRSGRSEEVEELVAGYACRVYDIRNVRWVTRTRREHIRDQPDVADLPATFDEKMDILEDGDSEAGDAEKEQAIKDMVSEMKDAQKRFAPTLAAPPPPRVDAEEYFADPQGGFVHLGRSVDVVCKEKTMKASVWMADNFPLTVQELVPLLALAAPTNKQFGKLVDFVESDLPPGFPVQIDIPVFSFLSAVTTFANFTEWKDLQDSQMPSSRPGDLPDTWFQVPEGYKRGTVIKDIFNKE